MRQCSLENVYCGVAEDKAIAWRSADIVLKLIMYSCSGKIKQRNLIVITSDICSSVAEKSLHLRVCIVKAITFSANGTL